MREVTEHHYDDHNRKINVLADEAGPGGASHYYNISVENGRDEHGPTYAPAGEVQFQEGPRHDPTHTPGLNEAALLAIVIDRLQAIQKGGLSCRENAIVLTKLEEAMHWLEHRARRRAREGTLGKLAERPGGIRDVQLRAMSQVSPDNIRKFAQAMAEDAVSRVTENISVQEGTGAMYGASPVAAKACQHTKEGAGDIHTCVLFKGHDAGRADAIHVGLRSGEGGLEPYFWSFTEDQPFGQRPVGFDSPHFTAQEAKADVYIGAGKTGNKNLILHTQINGHHLRIDLDSIVPKLKREVARWQDMRALDAEQAELEVPAARAEWKLGQLHQFSGAVKTLHPRWQAVIDAMQRLCNRQCPPTHLSIPLVAWIRLAQDGVGSGLIERDGYEKFLADRKYLGMDVDIVEDGPPWKETAVQWRDGDRVHQFEVVSFPI